MSTTTVVEGRFGKGSGNDSFSRSLYLLVRYYARLLDIVDAFCFGFTLEAGKDKVKVMILDADLNVDYLRLCHQIDGLLKQAGFEEIRKAHWRPFANLLTLEDEAEVGSTRRGKPTRISTAQSENCISAMESRSLIWLRKRIYSTRSTRIWSAIASASWT